MRLSRAVPLCLAALVGACSGATEPSPRFALLGRWVTEAQPLSPTGWHRYHLTFSPDGRFAAEVRMYGVYPRQGSDDLSATSRSVGFYDAEGDRVTFRVDSLIVWDRFYGTTSPPTVRALDPYGRLYDDARYTILGDRLALEYVSYPADAPVPARQDFRRVR